VQVNIKNLIDEVQCYQTVRDLRWPDGIACPSCQSKQVIKRARVSALALPSSESVWTERRLFVSQDLLRPSRKVPQRALDVRRGVGGPCRLCEPCQRLCPQCVDITLRHRASLYGSSPQSLARAPLPRL
jgi:DNA-directed RNA polymerase subunit RPC12/RpoP